MNEQEAKSRFPTSLPFSLRSINSKGNKIHFISFLV